MDRLRKAGANRGSRRFARRCCGGWKMNHRRRPWQRYDIIQPRIPRGRDGWTRIRKPGENYNVKNGAFCISCSAMRQSRIESFLSEQPHRPIEDENEDEDE